MTSWYCVEMWKLLVFSAGTIVGTLYVFKIPEMNIVAKSDFPSWMFRVIGVCLLIASWIFILIPTVAGGG